MIKRRQPVPLPSLEIQRMRRRHLRRVLSIESAVYPRPWSGSLFLSEMSQKSTRSYVVAKLNGDVVGYCGMMFTGPESHVTNIAVDPRVHGHKVGTRLLLTQINTALAQGAETVSLEVRVTNQAAQNMYAKFGFVEVGRRKGYYIETNEDALVMLVEDASSPVYRRRLRDIREELEAWERGE
ncbi:MAG: ribosomal protein S18-alanine N-acetyltransferase [Actinobacteria bacterium]|nr:ribosomal protein S18-alanine N-acetyltransferase [Actinomycetota bacterium]